MKKSYKLKNLGCPNCAEKMEADILKLEGVESARVNFMLSRLTIEAKEEAFLKVLEKAAKICADYEDDCEIIR